MNNSNIFLSVGIAVIMFGIGLNISIESFKRLFTKPKPIIVGLAGQLFLLPLVAFIIAFLWPMQDVYKAGLVLIAACPGGTASNLVTHMLKGKVALSVSLTAFNSFLILLTIPVIVNLATAHFLGESFDLQLSFLNMGQNVGLTVLLPVIVGMIVHELAPRHTSKLKQPLRYILPGILMAMFLVAILSDSSSSSTASGTLSTGLILLLPALLLNGVTILSGFLLGRFSGIEADGQYTIGIEMGLQNSALALYIANALIESSEMAFVAIVYSSFSFFTTWGLAAILKHRTRSNTL